MKRYLLALLLLTLQWMVAGSDYGSASAQQYANENYFECDDDGWTYISPVPCEGVDVCAQQCGYCGQYFPCDEFDNHDCPDKPKKVICEYCQMEFTQEEFKYHDCTHKPSDGDTGTGGGNTGGWNTGGGNTGGVGTGENDNNYVGALPQDYYIYEFRGDYKYVDLSKCKRFTVNELKFTSGVRLVKLDMPEKFIIQTYPHECVACAIGNITNINFGADSQNGREIIWRTAKNHNYDLSKNGIPNKKIPQVVKEYGLLIRDVYSESTIEDIIDKHQAVLGIINTKDGPHMVTIIGYDFNSYYCAVGYEDPVRLPKEALGNYNIFTLNNKNIIYRCKRF